MKFRLFLFSIIILFVMLSCKSGDSGTDTNGNSGEQFDQIKSTTITSAGGIIEATDIALTVPPNGVAGSATVNLSTSQRQLDAPLAVTKLYKIESNADLDLSYLKVKYNGTLSGESYIVWQEDNYIPSAGKMAASMIMIPARDSSGYLVASLSSLGSTQILKAGSYNAAVPAGFFFGRTGQTTLNTGSHFKVYYPTANVAEAQNLYTYLENAYTLLQGYGFNFIGRDWPAQIYLERFDGWYNSMFFSNEAYGYYVTTTRNPAYLAYRTNNCALYFNLNLMGVTTEMKATAGHEFFHAVQDLYDLRDMSTKKYSAASQTWLDEACATWFEEKMNPGTSYVSTVLPANALEFMNGMHVTGSSAGVHGYGMAPMIKYIAGKKGNSAVSGMYDKISLGSHPADAVFAAVNGSTGNYNGDWYNDFLKEYVTGNIYSLSSGVFVNLSSDKKWESKVITDTLNNFSSVSYPEFSGQLYMVTLSVADIAQKSITVNAKASSSASKVQIFKFGTTNVFLNGGTGEAALTPSDVKGSITSQNKAPFIILVTNTDHQSGFAGRKDVSLQIKINYNAGSTITLNPSYWEGGVNESKMFSLTTANLPQRYRFDWSWGDGAVESTTSPSGTHAYSSAGVYTIGVSLYDLDLNQITATAEGTAKVADNPARINPGGSEGLINTGYQWNVITDYNLSNARYEWDFGDGSSKVTVYNNKTASHSYTALGTYTIKVDIYNNANGVKIESASTTFKVTEVGPLLAAIKTATSINMDATINFANGTENYQYLYYMGVINGFNLPNVTTQTITWTGINTFTALRNDTGNGTPMTLTIQGTVSMDGQSITLEWLDHEVGTGNNSWYFDELKINLQNIALTESGDQTIVAKYKITNSTNFTGYIKKTDVADPHTLRTYTTPRSSNISITFEK